jgi:regulator of sigma E protease
MEFVGGLGLWGTGLFGWVIPFLFVLAIVVFIHELGHFLVARWCGVKVLTFSIGFGPEIAGFNDRHGTRWKIAAIPLGGYVKFFGDENAASVPDHAAAAAMSPAERRDSFIYKPVAQRAAIVVAGPLANFLLAILIFAAVALIYGKQITTARVDTVQPGSPAAAAGFKPGDLVTRVDGRAIENFLDLQRIVATSAGVTLEIEVERGGVRTILKATPELEQDQRFKERVGRLGITRTMNPDDIRTERVGPLSALAIGFEETWRVIESTMTYLYHLVHGRASPDQLGGPIRIAEVAGQVASLGLLAVINLAAFLSVSIGLLNLFPIPLLDGGHLMYYAIEATRGRPLSERAQEVGFRIGLALVLMLMIYTTYNDILRLLNRLWAA